LAFFNKRNKKLYKRYGKATELDGSSLGWDSKIKPFGSKTVSEDNEEPKVEW